MPYMGQPTAQELGYKSKGYEDVQAGHDHDLVPVGQSIKRGDEYLTDGGWAVLSDKHLHAVIGTNYKPIRRRRRWSCWHLRAAKEKSCPVCIVFHRYVDTPW